MVPHLPYLARMAKRVARPPIDPDDLVQDTLTRAWKYWETFRPDSNCRAWLARILANVLKLHVVKTAEWRQILSIDDLNSVTLAGPPARFSFDTERILEVLAPCNRHVVALIVIEGYTYAETAVELGVPIGTVMSRFNRSRKKLARTLVQ